MFKGTHETILQAIIHTYCFILSVLLAWRKYKSFDSEDNYKKFKTLETEL